MVSLIVLEIVVFDSDHEETVIRQIQNFGNVVSVHRLDK
jgi:hypothetical protein